MADKLEERLRALTWPLHPEDERNSFRNPDGPEAADEITRLNAENEELRAALLDTQERSRARGALVDEMREGLERVIAHPAVELCDCGEPGCLTFDLRALITKASRDSGHETRA